MRGLGLVPQAGALLGDGAGRLHGGRDGHSGHRRGCDLRVVVASAAAAGRHRDQCDDCKQHQRRWGPEGAIHLVSSFVDLGQGYDAAAPLLARRRNALTGSATCSALNGHEDRLCADHRASLVVHFVLNIFRPGAATPHHHERVREVAPVAGV